jgi:8-oxo-dGTP pyrophosphatase MutT (NUDIX family)
MIPTNPKKQIYKKLADVLTCLSQNIADEKYQKKTDELCERSVDLTRWNAACVCLKVEDSLFFIKRSEKMKSFKGQIAFIGGHRDEAETDPVQVALREFEEETSISRDLIEVKGILPGVETINRKVIIPIYAQSKLSKEKFLSQARSNGEWDYGFFVPMDHFLESKFWSFGVGHVRQKKRHILFNSLPQNKSLWGATAKMVWGLVNLYKI